MRRRYDAVSTPGTTVADGERRFLPIASSAIAEARTTVIVLDTQLADGKTNRHGHRRSSEKKHPKEPHWHIFFRTKEGPGMWLLLTLLFIAISNACEGASLGISCMSCGVFCNGQTCNPCAGPSCVSCGSASICCPIGHTAFCDCNGNNFPGHQARCVCQ